VTAEREIGRQKAQFQDLGIMAHWDAPSIYSTMGVLLHAIFRH
jgi:hypothetical protein